MRLLSLYAVLAVALVLLSACEETVDPILDSDRRFTLFGTLDMALDTQYVRVIPIRATLERDDRTPLNVTFTSTNLVTSETITWRDSTLRFDDGTFGHVFYAPLRVRPGHTYRIEVHPDDGSAATRAETTLPLEPDPIVMPEDVGTIFTTDIRGSQQILWQGISEKPFRIEHWYRFIPVEDFSFLDVQLPFEPRNGPSESRPNTWEVTLNLKTDRASLDELIDLNNKALAGLGMTITVLDAAFVPPGGAFDPEVLSQPGTLSNVENGFGFVGSVGRFSVEWLLADTSARLLRYQPARAFHKKGEPEYPRMLTRLKREAAPRNIR